MTKIGKGPFVVLIALAVAAMMSQASAQGAKPKAKMTREAAIRKCVEITQATPAKGGVDAQTIGVGVYKSCMTQAGHRP